MKKPKICKKRGCAVKSYALGYCKKHYDLLPSQKLRRKQYGAKYYVDNAEKIKATSAKYVEDNKEKVKEVLAAWYQKNKKRLKKKAKARYHRIKKEGIAV